MLLLGAILSIALVYLSYPQDGRQESLVFSSGMVTRHLHPKSISAPAEHGDTRL